MHTPSPHVILTLNCRSHVHASHLLVPSKRAIMGNRTTRKISFFQLQVETLCSISITYPLRQVELGNDNDLAWFTPVAPPPLRYPLIFHSEHRKHLSFVHEHRLCLTTRRIKNKPTYAAEYRNYCNFANRRGRMEPLNDEVIIKATASHRNASLHLHLSLTEFLTV
jgi:hypothetical protein